MYEPGLFDEDNDTVGAFMQGLRVEEDVDHEGHGGEGDEEHEEGGDEFDEDIHDDC